MRFFYWFSDCECWRLARFALSQASHDVEGQEGGRGGDGVEFGHLSGQAEVQAIPEPGQRERYGPPRTLPAHQVPFRVWLQQS